MKKPTSGRTEGERRDEETARPTGNEQAAAVAVVGIGASAGGLDAFKRFLQAMPADTGLALVLVPHLDPSHKSLMVELLARHTSMPVREAQDGMAVEGDRVYVIPPNRYLAADDGVLRLSDPPRSAGRPTAIDFFLRSLADAYRERAIGIVLSGTGSHGTLGLQAIKGRDGLTMVQEPSSAEYDQMPQSAIAAGLADYVLAPEAMPEALVQYVAHACRSGTWRRPSPAGEELGELGQVLALLRARTKYDFCCYRKKMLLRRMQRRMSVCHVDRLGDYLERLRSDAEEPGRLFRDLLIGVTGFFREPDAYAVLEQQVIVPLVEQADADCPVRVWVPGCSTGEEAYSIAILLVEGFLRRQRPCNIRIFATDIDEEALEAGRQGVYPESIAGDVSRERLQRFFVNTGEHRYQVAKQLRDAVTFAPQNLLSDAPFSRLDLISCRNLLIYLEPEVQRKVMALFHFALKDGGHLFLGASESGGQRSDLFEIVSKKWRLFRRIGATRHDLLEFPIVAASAGTGLLAPLPEQSAAPAKRAAALTQRLLLEDYAPAAVLVNHKYEILYFFGPTMRFLDQPTGEPSRDLMAMAREGLRTKLRAACHKALRERVPIAIGDAAVERNGGFAPVEVRVRPVLEPDYTEGLLLVTFADRAPEAQAPADAALTREAMDESSVVRHLDLELKATREDLQSTIEELESSNEELKASNEEVMSMNEELQSANEELESSKEELQSLNEELSTANSQLQDKVAELERSNNDITNLLSNTDISTLFLDSAMRIKLFTPPAARLFNLRPSDIERPLSDFSPNFSDDKLLADAEAVLERLVPLEKAVLTGEGRHFLRRIQPYRMQDKRIDGVVITFVDVTSRIRAEQQLRESEAKLKETNRGLEQRTAELARREGELSTLAANVPAMFSYVDAGEVYRYVNRLYERRYGLSAEQMVGKSVRELLGTANYAIVKPHIDKVLGGETERYEATFQFPDGVHTMDVVLVPEKDADGRTKGFFTLVHDITARKALERKLRDREQRLRAIVDTAGDAIITVDHQGVVQDYNPTAERMFGRPAAAVIGQGASLLLPPTCRDCPDYPACFRVGRCLHGTHRPQELMGRRQDDTLFPMEIMVSEIDDLSLYVALVRDISERRALEREIIEVSTAEQERIGRDIHDGIGQQLTALTMLAGSIENKLTAAQRPKEAKEVKALIGHLQDSLDQTRALARGLSPVEIDPEGLVDALSELTERIHTSAGVDCRLIADPALKVADEIFAVHLYRIAQEALHNALRHGQPRKIEVRLVQEDQDLVLSVYDDGIGIRPVEERKGGLGLHVMRYRAGIVRGQLTIETPREGGTLVTCRCPATG
ncbi:MAG: chemotaxis protein CheB [Chromatiaceae bacterium]